MAHFPKYVNSWQFPLPPHFSGYIFSIFLPAVFKTNQSTKLLPGNLLIPLFLRLRPPLRPSPSHASFKQMFCSYNQVFMANPLSANKHVSTHFFDWKTRLWHVSAILPKLKNDRLLDIFFQKTRQKSQLKRKKKFKKPRFHRRFSHKRASSHIPTSQPWKKIANNPIEVSLLAGQCWRTASTLPQIKGSMTTP